MEIVPVLYMDNGHVLLMVDDLNQWSNILTYDFLSPQISKESKDIIMREIIDLSKKTENRITTLIDKLDRL